MLALQSYNLRRLTHISKSWRQPDVAVVCLHGFTVGGEDVVRLKGVVMRNKSLFLVLPVLFILSVGAQEPTEPMPVEQEKQAAPELAPAEQKAQETPEITPAQPAPGQQEPKEMEITSIKKEESPVKEEGTNMKSVNIGLPEATLKSSIEMLKKLQADEYVLYTKTLKFHWNVTQNLNFKALHAFFQAC